jgi:hypothetical protein
MIIIQNLKKEIAIFPYDFRVDRASSVGNPFIMKVEKDRDSVCDKYEIWFYESLEKPEVKNYLDKIREAYLKYGTVRLFCWCAPKRCHAETIKKYFEEKIGS